MVRCGQGEGGEVIEFFCPGDPVPQERPRFVRWGNRVGVYDPPKSKAWKKAVSDTAKLHKVKTLEGPLYMVLHFKLKRPKYLKKKMACHVKKPDLDNLCKGCSDALNKIAFADDSQVVQLAASKEYSDRPGVLIKIGRIEWIPVKENSFNIEEFRLLWRKNNA